MHPADTRCKRRDGAWAVETNAKKRTKLRERAGVEWRRRFCGWGGPVLFPGVAKQGPPWGGGVPFLRRTNSKSGAPTGAAPPLLVDRGRNIECGATRHIATKRRVCVM